LSRRSTDRWIAGSTAFHPHGEGEQKYRNLELNPHVAVTTGANTLRSGLDLVIEGSAVVVPEGCAHEGVRVRQGHLRPDPLHVLSFVRRTF
jgi:hypothetical protein